MRSIIFICVVCLAYACGEDSDQVKTISPAMKLGPLVKAAQRLVTRLVLPDKVAVKLETKRALPGKVAVKLETKRAPLAKAAATLVTPDRAARSHSVFVQQR